MNNKYSGSPLWAPALSKQIINSIKFAPTGDGHHSDLRHLGRHNAVHELHVHQELGQPTAHGRRTSRRSRVSPDNGEHWGVYPQSVRPASADAIRGCRTFPARRTSRWARSSSLATATSTPSEHRPGAVDRRSWRESRRTMVPGAHQYEYWNSGGNLGAEQPGGRAAGVSPAPVGEMSVQYNTYLKQYLALYCNGNNDVVAQDRAGSARTVGSRADARLVDATSPAASTRRSCIPWSTGKELYYNLSLWSALQRDADENRAAVTLAEPFLGPNEPATRGRR